jgi:hypothetical protein
MKMGTASTSAQLTGNFAGALEDISIGDCRLLHLFAEKAAAEGSAIFAMLPRHLSVPSLEQ